MVVPERPGELGGLPVANRLGDFPDAQRALAQEFLGALHPHRPEVGSEARLAGLREGALELAGRGR